MGSWNPIDIIKIIIQHNPNMGEYARGIYNQYLLHGVIEIFLLIASIIGYIIMRKTIQYAKTKQTTR